SEAQLARVLRRNGLRLYRADRRSAREADDRLQVRIDALQRIDREAEAAPLRRHHFERIADRRRVETGQFGKKGRGNIAVAHIGVPFSRSFSMMAEPTRHAASSAGT